MKAVRGVVSADHTIALLEFEAEDWEKDKLDLSVIGFRMEVELAEEVTDIRKIEVLKGKIYPFTIYKLMGEKISVTVKEELLKRALKLLQSITGKDVKLERVKMYLWMAEYPVFIKKGRFAVVLSPYIMEEVL